MQGGDGVSHVTSTTCVSEQAGHVASVAVCGIGALSFEYMKMKMNNFFGSLAWNAALRCIP